jgi:hypothetical protein
MGLLAVKVWTPLVFKINLRSMQVLRGCDTLEL